MEKKNKNPAKELEDLILELCLKTRQTRWKAFCADRVIHGKGKKDKGHIVWPGRTKYRWEMKMEDWIEGCVINEKPVTALNGEGMWSHSCFIKISLCREWTEEGGTGGQWGQLGNQSPYGGPGHRSWRPGASAMAAKQHTGWKIVWVVRATWSGNQH